MIYDEFSPSRTRRTLTAGGRTLRALGLDGPLTGVLAIIVVIGVLLLWSAWSGSGRAPGMGLIGLRVVGRDGEQLSSGRAFWRAVLGVLTLGLGVVWVLVSKKNKSIYDILCGSAVVYEWRADLPASLPESRQNQ